MLADFRTWLEETGGTDVSPVQPSEGTGDMPVGIDLHTLLGQFLAVRQEVNLQTRAVRAQQEQNTETLRQLSASLDALRQSQARGDQMRQQNIDEAIRPLLKTLIDLYDALALAGREMQRLRETVLPSLEQFTKAAAAEPETRSWWRRLFRSSALAAEQTERERLVRENGERVGQLLASVVTGYTMSVQRLERARRQHGLEAIPTTGERFDPERMEVVEAVADSGRPSGEVLDEVRRGYLWNGRVFRYAQVRVAKG